MSVADYLNKQSEAHFKMDVDGNIIKYCVEENVTIVKDYLNLLETGILVPMSIIGSTVKYHVHLGGQRITLREYCLVPRKLSFTLMLHELMNFVMNLEHVIPITVDNLFLEISGLEKHKGKMKFMVMLCYPFEMHNGVGARGNVTQINVLCIYKSIKSLFKNKPEYRNVLDKVTSKYFSGILSKSCQFWI